MKLIVDDLATNYEDQGKGPVVLILHGWGSSLQTFDDLASRLGVNHRVVRLDWPGFGGSEPPPKPWGVPEFAGFAAKFLKKLELEPELLIGHSMGGQTAVYLVGAGLVKPNQLILLAASAIRPTKGLRETAYKFVAKAGKAVVRNPKTAAKLKKRLYEQAGTTDYLQSGPMQASYQLIVSQDQRVMARRIAIPTLLLWGEQDTDAPLERGKLLADCIHGSRLEIIPDAGHYMFLDEPEICWEYFKDFLE